MTRFLLTILSSLFLQIASAQIGYQIAVIDQNTGEAKAKSKVSVSVVLTDNAGTQFYSQTESVTTNELGIATIQIGNESTFSNVNWSKLPLWITATVDGVSMGKTQILTVPVAEHAKHTGTLTKEKLIGRWYTKGYAEYGFTFHSDGTAKRHYTGSTAPYTYEIDGNFVILTNSENNEDSYRGRHWIFHYSELNGRLVGSSDEDSFIMTR